MVIAFGIEREGHSHRCTHHNGYPDARNPTSHQSTVSVYSGKSPGIEREANVAGKTRWRARENCLTRARPSR